MGHLRPYTAGDIVSKYYKMNGKNVVYPIGWDAFGLPAENFAIKNKIHPDIATKQNVANAKKQLQNWGIGFDWSREINTTDPKYYKWTQKIFLEFLKAGLAYEKTGLINWCPKDKTGLANEEVIDGKCERCGTVVEKKELRQWYLKITDYAEKLLDGLKDLPEWPEAIKLQQENWIGKSEGVNFKQKIKDLDIEFEVYDSIPQTFLAQTFTVIAPDHKLIPELVRGTDREKEVLEFVERIADKKRKNKFDVEKDIEGIFTGRYVENPFGTGDLPLWVSSYVLADYGTGIVNCSAHDERDFAFAKKYNIPLKIALLPENKELAEKVKNLEVFYREPNGIIQTPEECKGMKWDESREKVIDYIIQKGYGKKTTQYKIRDWVFSRQRYWGEPIPVIHCSKCGVVPVPERDLPVVLPKVKNYEPTGTGESPLAGIEKWVNTKCPNCEAKKNETKYLIFDFDGVIGDTLEANIEARIKVGWAKDKKESFEKMFNYFTNKPRHANGHTLTENEIKDLQKGNADFGIHVKNHGYKIFDAFVKEIKKLKNVKIAVVSTGSKVYVSEGAKKTGLKNDYILTCEDSLSKEYKIEFIANKWKTNIKNVYYFTDSNADVYELENFVDRKKIIGCSWGYIGYGELKKVLPENQILQKFTDIHKIFEPGIAKRETNTMPQWAGSSWYWLRYCDPKNTKEFADIKKLKYWTPVDLYFGGMEHTTLHLLYSRFWNQFLFDRGLVTTKEPYIKRVPHGIILGPDGEKMSKSRGNVVNPDDIAKVYGVDTMRLYMAFLGPHGNQIAWNDKGIIGTRRFIDRVFSATEFLSKDEPREVTTAINKAVKKVGADIENMAFNTTVSTLMICLNSIYEHKKITKKSFEKFVQIMAPLAPHVTEELWNIFGNKKSIFLSKWPQIDEKFLIEDVSIAIQINGKVREVISLEKDTLESEMIEKAKNFGSIPERLAGKKIIKTIAVKNRIVNFVVKE